MGDLLLKEWDEVAGMEAVAYLVPFAIKADVLERFALLVAVEPVSKNPLIGFTELPRTGQHATTVDPDRKVERVAVFEGQLL